MPRIQREPNVWDNAGLPEPEDIPPAQEPKAPRWSSRPKTNFPPQTRSSNRGHQDSPPSQKNLRPEEVSIEVWALAEQWIEMATAKYGERPPVNKQNFSKRLSEKINSDPNLRYWLRVKSDQWKKFDGRWDDGKHFLNDVLYKMLNLFFNHLTRDQKLGSLQFAFLDDEWDEWVYQAVTAVQVAWLKEHGTRIKYELPQAVFDPTTVGVPSPEDPCTDPMFSGMTWGEVWAQDDEDIRNLPEAPEGGPDSVLVAMESAGETFARLKSVMVANREKTTTKETKA